MITKSLRVKFGESNLIAEFRGLIAAGLGDGMKDGFSKVAQVEVQLLAGLQHCPHQSLAAVSWAQEQTDSVSCFRIKNKMCP